MANRLGKFRRLLMALSVIITVCALDVAPSEAAETKSHSDLDVLGVLPPSPWDKHGFSKEMYLLAKNERRRRLYATYKDKLEGLTRLLTYEMTGSLPRPVSDVPVARGSLDFVAGVPFTRIAVDMLRNRLFISQATPDGRPVIYALSLDDGKVLGEWHLVEKGAPTLDVQAITYSEEDRRIYGVGETIVNETMENWHNHRPQAITAVVSINPDDNGSIQWLLPLLSCQQPINTYHGGALIARSSKSPALYVPCAQSITEPRTSGIAKVHLGNNAKAATQKEALDFQTEFFPISGQFYSNLINGVRAAMAFDAGSDRIFIESRSETAPGTWVFDGTLSSWVGFVYSPDYRLDALAVNEHTGHLYLSGSSGPFLVTNGRGTPVPQGKIFARHTEVRPFTDDLGRLVFTREYLSRTGLAPKDSTEVRWVALRDRIPDEPPVVPPDYDALTEDIPEDTANVGFAGGVSGYGSRVSLVGGWSGLMRGNPYGVTAQTLINNLRTPSNFGGFSINDVGVHPQDRTVMTARVANMDIRDSGSSASAQAVAADATTSDEWDTRRTTIASSCQKTSDRIGFTEVATEAGVENGGCTQSIADTSGDSLLSGAAETFPAWPWKPSTCLDGGGGAGDHPPVQESYGQGRAEVECSLDKEDTKAASEFGSFNVMGESSPTIRVGSSAFTGRTYRDRILGTVSEATATAKGIVIETAAAKVSIGQVTEQVRVWAAGRRSKAGVQGTRRLTAIVIERPGAEPHVIQRCENDSCADVLGRINRALGESIRAEMPKADEVATPKGAFAGYKKTTGRYFHELFTQNDDTRSVPALQITVFADSDRKSRLVLQFAAIEATAIYTLSKSQEYELPEDDVTAGNSSPPTGSAGIGAIGSDRQIDTPPVESTGAGGLEGVTALLARSPAQAAQFASVLLLFAIAALSLIRRSRNAAMLEGGG